MANIVLKDRVKVSSGVTGTGTATLGSAAVGYQDFSAIGDGNITYYTIALQSGNEWEVGKGTVTDTAGTYTLSRDTVFESSNAGSLVNFSAGTKDVFVTYPAERAIYEEPDGQTLIDGGPITVLGQGVTVNPSLEAELGKFVGNVDSFGQVYNLNQSDGSSASADFVVYNDATTDGFTNFTDMGLNSSNYSSVDYPLFTPGSGYVFHDGDDFFIGNQTAGKDVVLFAGGVDTANEAVRIKGADQSVELASDISVAGTATITGAAEFQSTVLLDADPTLALQAATKQYVDNATSNGFHVHTPVLVATTGNLTATYNNGTLGVGATLTNSGTQVALSVDGVALATNDRVLVWQQSTGTQNGVYVVTTVGSGAANWVLTRSADTDTSSEGDPNSLGGGDYFFVQSGATLGYFAFICNNTDIIVFGTTAISFTEFSQVPSYNVVAPLNLTGNTLSLTGVVAATNGGTGTNTVETGDILYGSGTDTWGRLARGTAYKSLVMNAGATNVEWNAVALNQSGAVSGTLPTTNGGTGLTTYTLGDLLYSSAANTIAKLAGNTTTTKTFLVQTGTGAASAAPSWGTIAASDVSGLAPSATTDTTNAANITSGTLPVARLNGSYTGITGVGTLAAGTWNGSTVAAAYGGTGQSSYAVGDLLYASTTTALSKLADVASGNALLSGGVGTAPAWGKIGLTTHISGTLAIANGGTGATDAATARANLGAGTGNGSVTSVAAGSYLTGGTITTTGTLAVDATTTNTASKVVARDASGNFSAGTITANLTGTASLATTATNQSGGTVNATTGAFSGVITSTASGTVLNMAGQSDSFGYNATAGRGTYIKGTTGTYLYGGGAFYDGTTVQTLLTSGNYTSYVNNGTLTMAVSGTGLSGSASFTANQSGATTFTVTSNATSANTASAIVARDGSGNFSAGTITATLSGNATSATSATTATNATNVTLTTSATASAFKVPFANTTVSTTGNYGLLQDSLAEFTYNPSTNTLTAGTFSGALSGNATTATTATNATNVAITNDTTTNATYYPAFMTATSGNGDVRVSSTKLTYNPSTGAFSSTSHVSTSDESLKKNWRDLPTDYVERLAVVKHGTYDRVDHDLTQDGVSAQSLQPLLPNSVLTGADGILAVNYGNAALVSAIQLAQRVVEQDARIAKLEALVAQLTKGNTP